MRSNHHIHDIINQHTHHGFSGCLRNFASHVLSRPSKSQDTAGVRAVA